MHINYELCLLLYNRTGVLLESRKFNENKMLNKYMVIFLEIMFFYVFTYTILSQIVCIPNLTLIR